MSKFFKFHLILFSLIFGVVSCGNDNVADKDDLTPQSAAPPMAKKDPFVDNFHNDPRTDDYRWMHDNKDPEVIEHLKAENKYSDIVLEKHSKLVANIKTDYEALRQEVSEVMVTATASYIYYKTKKRTESYWQWFRKSKASGETELVFNETDLAKGHAFYRTLGFSINPNEKRVLVLGDFSGRRIGKPHLIDLKTKEVTVLPTQYLWYVGYFALPNLWVGDNKLLFLGNTDEIDPQEVYSYDVGAKTENLIKKFSEKDSIRQLRVSGDGHFKGVTLAKTKSTETYVYKGDTETLELLSERREGIREYFRHNHMGWFKYSNEHHKSFAFYKKVDDQWQALYKPNKGNIESVFLGKDSAVFHQNFEGLESVVVLDLKTNATHVVPAELEALSYSDFFIDSDLQRLYFTAQSYAQPKKTYSCSLEDCQPQLETEAVFGSFNPKDYEVKRASVTVRDGVSVPLTLVYKKSLYTGRNMPVHMTGYGSYGMSLSPRFKHKEIALLDRGVVYAVAHIRGGGEKGADWHDQGRYYNKMNTFNDFIDVAKHLIASGLTSPDKLSITGRSAGGLLMGTVLNMAPELFRVATVGVPFVDVLNTMTLYYDPLAKFEKKEWGDGLIKEEYELIKSYDPYTNLGRKKYPSIHVITGFEDTAVYYFQPMKWVAKMRELNPYQSSRPLIFRTNFSAGHSGGSDIDARELDDAVEMAFILGELGFKKSVQAK